MSSTAFDLGEHLELRKLEYKVSSRLWGQYKKPKVDISFQNWNSIKYLNKAGTDFNSNILKIPNKKGGLYLFYVKCPIISGITEYPCYIGRAQLTKGQNLRKRVKEYFQHYNNPNKEERPKITRMFKYWSTDLHLAYLPLNNNKDIIDFEEEIINSLLFPMNDQIPRKEIRAAIKAFK